MSRSHAVKTIDSKVSTKNTILFFGFFSFLSAALLLSAPKHAQEHYLPPVQGVLRQLQSRGISVRVATKHLAAEEAPESYKVRCSQNALGRRLQPIGGSQPWAEAERETKPLCFPSLQCLQDVDAVVQTCHEAGISRKVVRLRPVAVVKG